jgi:hypothetical protein
MPVQVPLLREWGATDPSAIVSARRVLEGLIVVELTDLIAEVQERDSARTQDYRVRQHNP